MFGGVARGDRRPRWVIRLGVTFFTLGVVWDVVYHAALWLFGAVWPAVVDTVGEWGHTVTFAGVVVIIFAALQKHAQGR